MSRLELSLREIYEIQHICSESEAVSELFDEDGKVYDEEIPRLRHAQVDECQARECHACSHRPQRFLQAPSGCRNASNNPAKGQCGHSDCPVDYPHAFRRKAQSPSLLRIQQERVHHLHQECLRKPVQKHEKYGNACMSLPEECGECARELAHYLRYRAGGGTSVSGKVSGAVSPIVITSFTGTPPLHSRKHESMVNGHGSEKQGAQHEGHSPGLRHIGITGLQQARYHHQDPLPENGCAPVESAPYPHEE